MVEQVGEWLAKNYQVISKLGEGNYGVVYAVKPKKSNLFGFPHHREACKLIKDKDISHREAKILRSLKGVKGVVSLKKFHEDPDATCLVMELCECDLLHALDKGIIYPGEPDAARVILSLAKTLKEVHARKIVHRDIKLTNILVTKDRHVKLGDFGSATYLNPEEQLHEFVGTRGYIAPEVQAGDYGKEVDIYNLGLILYCLIELREPFPGGKRDELKFCHASRASQELLLKMTHPDPSKRITLDEVVGDPWLCRVSKFKL